MVDRNWHKHMSNTLDVTIHLGQSPIFNRRILKTLKAISQKWFSENHIQTALSKLSVKTLERIWEGWGAKREHVEAITGQQAGSVSFRLAVCLQAAEQPAKSVSTIKQPHNTSSSTDCETLMSFKMLLSLCISVWERGTNVWILIQTVTCLPRPKRKSHMEM